MTGRRASLGLLLGLLAALTAGCAMTPCDELADAAAEGGCSTSEQGAPAIECEGEAEAYADCWLENVVDVCSPTTDELLAVADCRGR